MPDKPESGQQQKPEKIVHLNGSSAEIYDFRGILADATTNPISVYKRSDFDTPIESAQLTVSRVKLPERNDHGYAYHAEIKLDESSQNLQTITNRIRTIYSHVEPLAQQPQRIGETTLEKTVFNNVFRVTGKSGIRVLIWVDNDKIVISNDFQLRGKNKEGEEVTYKALPISESTADELGLFSDFLQVFIDAANVAAAEESRFYGPQRKNLNRVFPIGRQRTQVLTKAATEGPPSPRQGEKPTKDKIPAEEFEPKHSAETLTLNDVIVPEHIKKNLQDVVISFKHPEIMSKWGAQRPQGIILYGEPGTGKTMLVHAIASELGAEIMEIKGGDLYQKWLGESEKKMQEIFDTAKKSQGPLVLFFDEFESVIGITSDPTTGGADNARNAVAGIFKVEMNSLRKQNPNVLVVGVTNFPDRVDESLIRSGRIDLKFYIPMPDTEARQKIIEGIIRKSAKAQQENFSIFAADIDTKSLAEQSDSLSGADLDEIFRRLKFEKAMSEAREKEKPKDAQEPVKPITNGEIVREIAVFLQNKSS